MPTLIVKIALKSIKSSSETMLEFTKRKPVLLVISILITGDLVSKARLTLKKLTLSFDYLVY